MLWFNISNSMVKSDETLFLESETPILLCSGNKILNSYCIVHARYFIYVVLYIPFSQYRMRIQETQSCSYCHWYLWCTLWLPSSLKGHAVQRELHVVHREYILRHCVFKMSIPNWGYKTRFVGIILSVKTVYSEFFDTYCISWDINFKLT